MDIKKEIRNKIQEYGVKDMEWGERKKSWEYKPGKMSKSIRGKNYHQKKFKFKPIKFFGRGLSEITVSGDISSRVGLSKKIRIRVKNRKKKINVRV